MFHLKTGRGPTILSLPRQAAVGMAFTFVLTANAMRERGETCPIIG